MSEIQIALVNAGLTTPAKINAINRQKAIDEHFVRVAQKAKPGASPKTWVKYANLKKLASKDLQLSY